MKTTILKLLKIVFTFLLVLASFQLIQRMNYAGKIRQISHDTKITIDRKEYQHQHQHQHASHERGIKSMSKDHCRDILACLTDGSWSLKEGLTQDDIQNRVRMDEFILEYEGFPKKLTRQDGRCGKRFPLSANGKLGSLCDELGTKPCCNELQGRCGNTSKYCNCKHCTDFRNHLPAEIAQWNPKNMECRIKDFNHIDACTFFGMHVSEMVFIGDSLTRHFFGALALLLTDNFTMGALNVNADFKRRVNCQGELQFIDRGRYDCNEIAARRWEELLPICEAKTKFRISLLEAYNFYLFPRAREAVTKLLNKTGSFVILNVGLHMAHNSKEVIDKYVGPIVDMVTKDSNGWPKIIWHNLHGIDNFLRSDIHTIFPKWERYNKQMSSYLRKRGIAILDSSRLTRGIKSYDARHFGLGGNMIKVQVLINYLEQWIKMCKKYEIR